MSDTEARSIELERTLDASPEEVWDALTTPDGLERWFPLEARVDPGVGGSIWLSWGPGADGEAPIRIWEPGRRFGWTESHGTDADGRPIQVTVDFHIEGREGSTVVRLVQSGFSASSDRDEMYDALTDGWTHFLFNLAFYFLRHRGRKRTMVWKRQKTTLARSAVWKRLRESGLVGVVPGESTGDTDASTVTIRLDAAHAARIVSTRPEHHFAAVLPDLGDAVWFVELEGKHVGFWLSVYEPEAADTSMLQDTLADLVEAVLDVAE